MKQWNTVTIVGVGLIGGSIGLALRQRRLARTVIGIGRRVSSLKKAKAAGAVDVTTLNCKRGVADADLVVVCTPVANIVADVQAIAKACPPHALITDVGSTKASIVSELETKLAKSARFVGSHPLAGSEKNGPENAEADLFDGRIVVVTPGRKTDANAAEAVSEFWVSLGAMVLQMSPTDHDRAMAAVSHVPHLIAAALAGNTPPEDLQLTATGWRDTTRIASGDGALWRQILLDNRANVLKSLAGFEKTLADYRQALKSGDGARIEQLLAEAKRIRDAVGS